MKTRLLPLLLFIPCAAFAETGSILPDDLGVAATVRQSPFADGDAELGATVVSRDQDGFDIPGLTWSFSKHDTQQLYVGAGMDEWDHKRGDSPQLRDMDKLDRAINLRLGSAWKLPSGAVNAEIDKDVAAHKGTQAKLRYTLNSLTELAVVRPYVEAQWLSSGLTDYYVGVNANEAKPGRPAYQAGSALAAKAGLRLEKPLTAKWTLVGGVDATHYPAAITNSPIVDKSTVWGGQVGLTYNWR
jgi:outer membrane scaffolding protein for murein synthesis (MipA/OmpV family)